jgi:hypothetical protein
MEDLHGHTAAALASDNGYFDQAHLTLDVARFAATRNAVARIWAHYDDKELGVILDFLGRNTERLIRETAKLTSGGRSHCDDD